jgi:hypothetical protein
MHQIKMNENVQIQKEVVLHTQFNQDGSWLAVSTNFGFKIFQIMDPQNIIKLYERSDIGIVTLIEM